MSDQQSPYPPSDGYIPHPAPPDVTPAAAPGVTPPPPPPPDVTPPPASGGTPPSAGPYGGDAYQPTTQPAYGPSRSSSGGTKRTAVIIAIVVGSLLLCCCLSAVGFFLFASSSDSDSISADFNIGTSDDARPDDTARRLEWEDWQPELTEAPLAEAPSEKTALIDESLGIVAPGFEAEDYFWIPGYYSADEDWYYADYVIVTARHPASDALWAGIEFSIQSDEMVAEDVAFEPEQGDVVTAIAGGARELEYYPTWDSGIDEDLWRQVGDDWPGAVVMEFYDSDALLGGITVELTNWDAYVTEGWSPRVVATYQDNGDGWELVEWRYEYPEDEGTDEEGPAGSPT